MHFIIDEREGKCFTKNLITRYIVAPYTVGDGKVIS